MISEKKSEYLLWEKTLDYDEALWSLTMSAFGKSSIAMLILPKSYANI